MIFAQFQNNITAAFTHCHSRDESYEEKYLNRKKNKLHMDEREKRRKELRSQATNRKVEDSSGIEMVNGILLFAYNIYV